MKMSWISKRTTTREEDMAYCLLGIFDVNMPMLYGEGRKAFMRLQLELIRKSSDESIFAWRQRDGDMSGLLAEWPTAFKSSGNIVKFRPRFGDRLPYAMTNQGLELRIPCPGDGYPLDADNHYRDIEVRVAVRQGFRAFQLNCGTNSSIDRSDLEHPDYREARQNTIVINLVRQPKSTKSSGFVTDIRPPAPSSLRLSPELQLTHSCRALSVDGRVGLSSRDPCHPIGV